MRSAAPKRLICEAKLNSQRKAARGKSPHHPAAIKQRELSWKNLLSSEILSPLHSCLHPSSSCPLYMQTNGIRLLCLPLADRFRFQDKYCPPGPICSSSSIASTTKLCGFPTRIEPM